MSRRALEDIGSNPMPATNKFMGLTGIDRSVQRHSNHAADDIMLKSYQTINANNNTISAESRTFADAVEAKIISLFAQEEVALAA